MRIFLSHSSADKAFADEIRNHIDDKRDELRVHGLAYSSDGYDAEGRPLQKMFLRSPMRYSRVTSNFSNRRFHPVLKTYRPHYGVDYGAPAGTPVRELFERQIDGKEPDDFVFTTLYGKQWSQANLAKAHNTVRDEGKFSKNFESYVWRHCRISDWADEFAAPAVAAIAGTSLEFLQKNYYKENSKINDQIAEF